MAALVTLIAFLLDWIIGDPQRWPHPVRYIGRLIENCEDTARSLTKNRDMALRAAGLGLAIFVPLTSLSVAYLILWAAGLAGLWLWFLAALYLVYSSLCLRDLYKQSWDVEKALAAGDLEEARRLLSWVVGRDTENLDERQIRRAVIETVAENLSDGLIAPLFYLALGGPVLVWAYKAVNTLDSMVGYKNERYLNLGRYSALLDDILNYLPARLAALLLITSAFWQRRDWRRALAIWRRDSRLHSSPNSGHPEAAMAGALNLWLGGPSYYGGVLSDKPRINAEGGEADSTSLKVAERLMMGAAVLMAAFTALFLAVCGGVWGWVL